MKAMTSADVPAASAIDWNCINALPPCHHLFSFDRLLSEMDGKKICICATDKKKEKPLKDGSNLPSLIL